MWTDVIELGNQAETITLGEPIKTMTWTTVFANKKSVRQSEFYQAAGTGLKPEIVFEVHDFEFNNHEYVRYNSKVFTVIRTYEKDGVVELTLSSFKGVEV